MADDYSGWGMVSEANSSQREQGSGDRKASDARGVEGRK